MRAAVATENSRLPKPGGSPGGTLLLWEAALEWIAAAPCDGPEAPSCRERLPQARWCGSCIAHQALEDAKIDAPFTLSDEVEEARSAWREFVGELRRQADPLLDWLTRRRR